MSDGFALLSRLLCAALLLVAVGLLSANAVAAGPVQDGAVEAELVADRDALVPGQPLRLGLRLAHEPGWHTYWRNPGDSGLPTRFEPELPPGFDVGPIEWPAPARLLVPPLANYGYEGEIVLPRRVTVPVSPDADSMRFQVSASWLVCREVCIPGQAELELILPVRAQAGPGPHHRLFERAAARLPAASVAADYRIGADGTLSIVVPDDAAGADASVEFFPFAEGMIAGASPQRLYRLDDGRRRLEIALADGARLDETGVAGVLVGSDGSRPLEIHAGRAIELAQGQLVAVAEGIMVDLSGGTSASASGLAGRLRGLVGTAPVQGASALASAAPAPVSRAAGPGLALVLLFAFAGGLILNLMPCVFPVIGLKILGFADQGAGGMRLDARQRYQVRRGAGWFAVGVVASFWALAGILLALRSSGAALGWGFQLQSPPFVAGMGLLFVAIGLNLAGVYEFGASLTRAGSADRVDEGRPVLSALASGGLAVLVATPCTAPFMGAALGFTLTQSAAVSFAVFTALGLGMATPYLLLGLFPGWLRLLPRPGRWMESLRQLLAFPMFAAAAWLAWVLGRQSGVDAIFGFALAAILLATGLWAWGRFGQASNAGVPRRALAGVLALACIGAGVALAAQGARHNQAPDKATRAEATGWQEWSSARLEQALAAGEPVFVDFTAAWCVSCQANKLLVLDTEAMREQFARRGITLLQADWTRQDPAITAELARHGRNGVPLYLLYDGHDPQPRILPELLSSGIVLAALDTIARR